MVVQLKVDVVGLVAAGRSGSATNVSLVGGFQTGRCLTRCSFSRSVAAEGFARLRGQRSIRLKPMGDPKLYPDKWGNSCPQDGGECHEWVNLHAKTHATHLCGTQITPVKRCEPKVNIETG